MDYNILIELKGNIVTVDLNISLEENKKVYYYLCSGNGETIAKSGWRDSSYYSFELLETGNYYIKSFILYEDKKYVKKSRNFDYITREDQEKFQNFCLVDKSYSKLNEMNPWHFYHVKFPYRDFCFAKGFDNINEISKFCKDYDFETVKCFENTQKEDGLLIKDKEVEFKQKGVLFSGIGRIGKQLYEGNIGENVDLDNNPLENSLGTFTFFRTCNGKVELGTDYFGLGKLYYYKRGKQFVCANNYHMLVILLHYLDEKLEINYDVINALLCKMNQPFSQRFTRECEISNIYLLPVGKKIVIREDVLFDDTEIQDAFQIDRTFTQQEYVELLESGREEILDNTNAALSYDNYDEFVVELTGGLDSRIVYGALTNFDLTNKQVYINTIKGKDNEADIEIATQINNIYNFPWDNRHNIVRKKSYKSVQNDINSHFILGGYFFPLDYYPSSYNIMLENLENEKKVLNFHGFFGEICCRPYFTREMLKKYEGIETFDIEEFMPVCINRKDILSEKSYSLLCSVMKEELEKIPGKSFVERYEMYYLFYRNRFHCSKVREYEISSSWGVLQSKNLFKLCRKIYYDKKDIKVQLDVINQINPLLGCVPYEAEKDNLAKQKLKEELYYSDRIYQNANLSFKSNREKWECACCELEDKIEYIIDENLDFHTIEEENEIWKQQWKERMELLLHGLMRYRNGIFKEQFGLDVYLQFCLRKNKTDLYYKILYNKLLTIYLQLRMIDDEYDELFKKEN